MTPPQRHRPLLAERPHAWLWFVGTARIGAYLVLAWGTYRLAAHVELGYTLLGLYATAITISLLYLASIKRARLVPALLTWTQVLVDFGVVAAALAYTGGIRSSFTFLLVIVILEAGLLLGLAQGFVFATLAALFTAFLAATPAPPDPALPAQWLDVWYRFLIHGLAFYLTAFVSGFWNERVTRMEQFQRRTLDNMNNGFLMTNADGKVTLLNNAAQQILNVSESDAAGRPVQEILKPASGGECPVVTALRSGHNFLSYEFLAATATGESKLLGLTTSQVHDARGRLTDIITSFADLTEISRMRLELQSQERLVAVGELAAGLAHEIRNPVAAIRGALEEFPASMQTPTVAEKLANIAIRESDHLNEIVTGFLDFARNPSTKREIVDLRELVHEVEELLRREHGAGVAVTTVLPEAPCEVTGDRSQIKQVFVNLGKNAIEAMDDAGALIITVKSTPKFLEIRFDDEGPGIDPDKITHIFEPFYTEKEKGVGMGLAVCMRIITAHDGVIRAASREGGGASMAVQLPAAQRKE
ncbi:MAG: PAS domain-containing protein [Nitrospiraceae bacterium]|nr:PAS domain-containing protein [Nitrospiraceae bacterium]